MMTTLKSECRKFSPNIFNKAKCQNCFRTKESHSAEALESNRATRKVSKCGYLFVAPDWDFSVSINRTKRWQRRWFVLYDDGELTYSVDEHPDTVPQAVIDMNKVLEVSDAENVTGNQFAISITAPEKVHFVKGTSREESKWWFDVLNRLPRINMRGKHKRNATFPGGKATATSVTIIPDHEPSSEDHADLPLEVISRPRFLSTSEVHSKGNRKDWSWLQIDPNDEDVFPTRDQVGDDADDVDENQAPVPTFQENRPPSDVDINNAFNKLLSTTSNGRPVLQTNRLDNKNVDTETFNAEDQSKEKSQSFDVTDSGARKARNRRYQKRENRVLRNQRSRSDGVARMIPRPSDLTQDDMALGSKLFRESPVFLLLSEAKLSAQNEGRKLIRNVSPAPVRQRYTSSKNDTPKPALANHGKPDTPKPSRTLKKSESLMNIASDLSPEMRNRISELKRNHSYKGSPSMYKDKQMDPSQRSKTNAFISAIRPVRDTDPKPQVHGENDKSSGGPALLNTSLWEAGIDISTEDLLLKKGWLMRQTLSKEWSRHWFVLKNASLTYYRDPSAEDCGIMDGVLDLNQVTSIEEVNLDKSFAFCLIMWDNKKYILATVSTAVRSSWIKAVHHASNLWDSELRKDFSKDEIILPEHSFHSTDSKLNGRSQNRISSSSSLAPTPEPEKAQDLSSSDDQSEYFSIIDEEEVGERSSSPRTLPPSPPINRTPMSLVKERARSRSNLHSFPTRQSNFLTNTDCCDIKPEHNSDGANSDNSSSCTQESPLGPRKAYQDICSLMEDQIQLHRIATLSTDNCLKDFSDEKCLKLSALQTHCKNLEEQLSLKTKEANEKTLDLDAFRKLKTAYQTLIEQNKLIKKGQKITDKMSPVENLFEDNYRLKYELLKKKYIQDRMEWENKCKKDKSGCSKDNNIDACFKVLQKTKQLLSHMSAKLPGGEADEGTVKEIQQLCEEINQLSSGSERKAKRDIETKTMKKAILELQALYKIKKQKLEDEQKKNSSLKLEVEEKDKKIQELQQEFQALKSEIANNVVPRKFQEEFPNDSLGADVPDCDLKSCATCLQLNAKLNVGRDQIRRLQKDLKESHAKFDNLEIYCFKLEQEKKIQEESHQSQLGLMTARVDDLTSKFTLSEKNLRHLKQKMTKMESKQERRRSSLKNKEALSLSKECEAKLFELERKIVAIEDDLKEDKNAKDDVSLPVCQPPLEASEVNMDPERHLRKRLSQDSTSGSEHTGILSRLHTLGTRVKSATETLEKQNQENSEESDLYDKPKICFQVRNDEESSNAQEEVGEDWSTLSYATSLTDLQAIDGLDGEFPCSWTECFECLEQRLDNLLSWSKNAIHLMQKQEISTLENFQTGSAVNKDTVLLASSAIETLENLPDIKVEGVWGCNMTGDNTRLCYKILLLNEVGRTLQKIMNYESSTASEKLSICEFSFHYIHEQLKKMRKSDSKCILDFEKYSCLLEKLILMSNSSIDSLMNESLEEFSQLSQNRLAIIQEHCTALLNSLSDAKHRQFLAIHHMLADVPVQDAETATRRQSLNKQLRDTDPVLTNIEILVNQFFEGTIHQFYELECQNVCLMQGENDTWVKFCVGTSNSLKYAAQSVIQEIRKLYQQVHEDVFSFGISDSMYQKVLHACVELMQITLLQTILDSTLILISDENSVNIDVNNKAWIGRLHENLQNKALKISQYELLSTSSSTDFINHILDSGIREIKMTEQMEAVNHLHQRKLETLQNELEVLRLEKCQPKDGCERCEENTVKLQNLQSMFEDISKERKHCDQCQSLEIKFLSAKEKQEMELLGLQRQHKEKVEELHKHLQLVLDQKDEIHLKEVKKLEEELGVAHKRLNHLEIEYNEQIQSLRDLYEQKMSLKQDPINEESVRRRYQVEIEQLKGLCEKGLMAMENSYRRITTELEKRHKQELNMLEAEKEKVLQEETQATLTALEVMRKAHAEELQREINRFKEEFLRKMQSSHKAENVHQKQESELEEIKREILSISEKYSVKCLESASLEERVEVLYHQLQEANDQLIDLIARNKQLKVHLAMDIAEKKEIIEKSQDLESAESLQVLLKLKESEIVEHQEENAQLKQDLHLAQMHVSLLDVQCEQLNQSLKAERRFRDDEVSSLRTRLEAIITSSSVGNEESFKSPDRSYNRGTKLSSTRGFLHRSPSLNLHSHVLESASRRMLTFARTKELLRSPSCPGLENHNPS